MKATIQRSIILILFTVFAQVTLADVSGNWTFAVSLGELGSENADITYRGEMGDDGSVKGAVVVQGQDIGFFTGKKK